MYNKQSRKQERYNVGSTVICHAYIQIEENGKMTQPLFLCKGLITRQPTYYSNVYKVQITAINQNSQQNLILSKPMIDRLLGKKIPCKESQLFTQITEMMKKTYKDITWLSINPTKEEEMRNRLKRSLENQRY